MTAKRKIKKPAKPVYPSPELRKRRRFIVDIVMKCLIGLSIILLARVAILHDWMRIRNIEVIGALNLGVSDVIELAGLEDTDNMWVPFIRKESIRQSLENHPLIENANVIVTGPASIRIRINERRGIGALEVNGSRLVFDRTGEFIRVLDPCEIFTGRIVQNVPPGLLRQNGIPIHSISAAWGIENSQASMVSEAGNYSPIDRQFDRLIHCIYFIGKYGSDFDENFKSIKMVDSGCLCVEYTDFPPVLLGEFEYPEDQTRRMIAVLGNEDLRKNEHILYIDLSSMEFPNYRVDETMYSVDEKELIQKLADKNNDQEVDDITDMQDDSGSWQVVDASAGNPDSVDSNDSDGSFNDDIFNLAGG